MTDRSGDVCVLPRQFDIRCVEAIHAQLLEAWKGGEVAVDASEVEEADTAALQLLAALVTSGRARGVAVRIAGASDTLRQAASGLGLDDPGF